MSAEEERRFSFDPKAVELGGIIARCRIKREVDWELHIWENSRLIRHCGLAQIMLKNVEQLSLSEPS